MKFTSWSLLGVAIGVLAAVAPACGKPVSCPTGCFDSNKVCRAGNEAAFCGPAGGQCIACTNGTQCIAGVCTTGQNGGGSATGGGSNTGGGETGGGSQTGGGNGMTPDAGAGPTWYKDVLPITQVRCAGCHNAEGIGGFSLQTYAAAKPMAMSMANAVQERRMPPWMPDDTCGGPFVGSRRLSQTEIDTISNWANTGAAEGNVADAPLPVDHTGEQLARVDATMPMPVAYTPVVGNRDDYRCFLMDPGLTADKFITGFEIVPGAKAQVHHVILYVVDKATATTKDNGEAGTGWTCYGDPAIPNDGALGAWAPGSPAITYPAGTGVQIGAGKAIAMQVHYNTQIGTAPDQTTLKLMYANTAVTGAYLIPLVADGFAIPPNSTGYTYFDSFPNAFGIGVKVYGLLPHMHTKGTHIKMEGPSNSCLIDIPKWDFHWQQSYFRTTPFVLNPGQSIKMTCTWDNPTASTIRWGENTSNEMCFAYIYVTP